MGPGAASDALCAEWALADPGGRRSLVAWPRQSPWVFLDLKKKKKPSPPKILGV